MRIVYIFGIPGSGKSSMVDAALEVMDLTPEVVEKPVPHIRYDGWLWSLGRPRADFRGTDTLSMSIQPKVTAWLPEAATQGCEVLLGEGDRLANNKFFHAWGGMTLIYLDTPMSVARDRAAQRAVELGREPQNDTWWRGRVTKTFNLAKSNRHIPYDGRKPSYWLGGELAELLMAGREARREAK